MKKEIKMFSDNMILYIENPKEATQCTIRTKNLAKLQKTRSILKKNQSTSIY